MESFREKKRDEPYTVRFPKATIEDQLEKLISTCNWDYDRPDITPMKARNKIVTYLRYLLFLNQIEVRKRGRRLYILAYDTEKDLVYWQRLDFETFRPCILTIAMQQGLESQFSEEVALSTFNRIRPKQKPLLIG